MAKNSPFTPEPLEGGKRPPPNRFCDLVLTGGVTDGVVYPWAILELAREYRFKNIGGTSVGAMAAALTAAAEYGRRHGSLRGFDDVLRKLPERLAEIIDCKDTTRIFSLFQPAPSTRKLFDLFVDLFSSGDLSLQEAATTHVGLSRDKQEERAADQRRYLGATRAIFQRLRNIARVYRGAGLIGGFLGLVLLALVLLPLAENAAALPVLTILALVALTLPAMFLLGFGLIVYRIYRDLTGGLVENHFGLCTGMHIPGVPEDQPSIIEWLHKGIQASAGKPLYEPLTFKDLWEAPGGPSNGPLPPGWDKKPRSIDLRTITTNLTHGRPYEFPMAEQADRLFFDPAELREFFPEEIVAYLEKHSDPCPRGPADPLPSPETAGLRELPIAELPILVAARLSLSFPVLFSAVPLWAIDYEAPKGANRKIRRCRFSDGGICSNFPIHMFDAAVPEWPTFGIALESRSIHRKNEPLWVSKVHSEGRHDIWYRFDDRTTPDTQEEVSGLKRLMGFVGAVFYSAKDWNDKTASRMPGARDRVVHVTLEEVGGLNLKLSHDDLLELAETYGPPAGKALVEKFLHHPGRRPLRKWEEHRWVRFNVFLVGLRQRIQLIKEATERRSYGLPVSQQIAEAERDRPLDGLGEQEDILKPEHARDLSALLAMLKDLENAFDGAALPQPYTPTPNPTLHIRAPL
jgi:predicted acylesterase/phospholipase RssA